MSIPVFRRISVLMIICLAAAGSAQPLLPENPELPDPFLMASGRRVATVEDWHARREELKTLILKYGYGKAPAAPGNIQATANPSASVLGGKATETRLRLAFGPDHKAGMAVRLLVPAQGKGPFPVVLRNDDGLDRCPIAEALIDRGYILAEFVRTDVAPDDSGRGGALKLYPGNDWGVLAAWAWGFSRMVDYLLTLDKVDAAHIAIAGHSRGGKTTLLAGALDERIALTVPAGSGTGGCAVFRFPGHGSETLAAITGRFGYWFVPALKDFAGAEARLPFDQHELKAMVAPRALLCEDATGDAVGNPRGAQVSHWAAREVYRFLGVPGKIGVHMRTGGHEQNADDWRALLDFADLQFFGKATQRNFDSTYFAGLEKGFSWMAPKTVSLIPRAQPRAAAGYGKHPPAGRDGLGRFRVWRTPKR